MCVERTKREPMCTAKLPGGLTKHWCHRWQRKASDSPACLFTVLFAWFRGPKRAGFTLLDCAKPVLNTIIVCAQTRGSAVSSDPPPRPDWQAGPEEWGKYVVCGWSKQTLKAATNRSTETTFTHERLQGTRWSQGDSPEGLRVYPGQDQGAPTAVCQRRSPNSRRSERVRTGLPAAWRSAPVGWLWPPAPTTPPTRAPRSAWAPGWVLKVAPWCEERQPVIPGREFAISEHCAVCYNRTATSFVSACSKYSCTIGVTVFSKSLSSSGRTNVSYTQFSCQSITSITELQPPSGSSQ